MHQLLFTSGPISPEQLGQVEDTYKGLFARTDLQKEFGGPGVDVKDYRYILALLEQLIHNARNDRALC
jgi:hypothetical protein